MKKRLLSLILIFTLIMPNITVLASTDLTNDLDANLLPNNYVDDSNDDLDDILNDSISTFLTNDDLKGKKVDLVFAIDTTGSMSSYIKSVKNNIVQFSNYLETNGIDLRIGLVEYRDITVDGKDSTKIHKPLFSNWYSSANKFSNALTNLSVGGGGDADETALDALGFVVNEYNWSSKAYKFCVVLTDAKTKIDNTHGYTSMNDVVNDLLNEGINTSVISMSGYSAHYKPLYEGTGGIFANINGDFSIELQLLAESIISGVIKNDKAIYILPGYLASKLFNENDKHIWAHVNMIPEIAKGKNSILSHNKYGEDGKLHADIDLDKYGPVDIYKDLVTRLESDFQSLGYDIIYFPYNWLGDLHDSSSELEKHINASGYKEISFVTHSTGGLLAATYMSKASNANKVDKTVLVAPPLYGTYASLEPIEKGTYSFDNGGIMSGVLDMAIGLAAGLYEDWVAGWARTSSTTHQLLPSDEYLKKMPLLYDEKLGPWKLEEIDTIERYYEILGKSDNINNNLLTNTNRSHKYLRETTLDKNIVTILNRADTTVIATTNGFLTPTQAVYDEEIVGTNTKFTKIDTSYDGDGTVHAISTNVKGLATYIPTKKVVHSKLATNKDVMPVISSMLLGTFEKAKSEIQVKGSDSGMDDFLEFAFVSDKAVSLTIYDKENKIIAKKSSTEHFGFTDEGEQEGLDQILLQSYYDSENGTHVYTLNIRNKQARLVIENENPANGIDIDLMVSTLGDGGHYTSQASYQLVKSKEPVLFDIDYRNFVMDKNKILEIDDDAFLTSISYFADWKLSDNEYVFSNIGESHTLEMLGSDVDNSNITPNDVQWTSSNEKVVTVSENGELTAVGYGEAIIRVRNNDRSYKQERCEVLVELIADSVSFEDVTMSIDEKYYIEPIFTPNEPTNTDIQYEYDKSAGIVNITAHGRITPIKAGTIEVKGTAYGGTSSTFTITVVDDRDIGVDDVKITNPISELEINKTYRLYSQITPSNASEKGVRWYTTDENVASIENFADDYADIKANSLGKCTIVVVSDDGDYIDEMDLSVVDGKYIDGDIDDDGYTVVMSLESLAEIRHNTKGKYRLYKDIDLSREVWTAIGTTENPFMGHFDGNGHSLSNLTLNPEDVYSGLFGVIDRSVIENIHIKNVNITKTAPYIGGIVGLATNSYIRDSSVEGGQIESTSGASYIGGIVGRASDTTLERNMTSLIIKGKSVTGSMVGSGYESVIIRDSYSLSTVFGNQSAFGYMGSGGKIENSYFAGKISSGSIGLGGSYNKGNYYNVDIQGKSTNTADIAIGRTTEEMMQQSTFEGWDFENVWSLGGGEYSMPYLKHIPEGMIIEVSSVTDLEKIRENPVCNYKLMTDLDLSGKVWTSIGTTENPFVGHFDGNGHSISNITLNPEDQYSGLFGVIDNSMIENLHIKNVNITKVTSYVGGIVGLSTNSSIRDSSVVDGQIESTTGASYMGGIAGRASDTKLERNMTDLTIKGNSFTGAMVGSGYESVIIRDSYSLSTVFGNQSAFGYMGSGGKIENSYFAGTISSNVIGLGGSNNKGNYYNVDIQVKSTNAADISTGRTMEEMMKQATYEGWDFENVWKIEEGIGYPTLRRQE